MKLSRSPRQILALTILAGSLTLVLHAATIAITPANPTIIVGQTQQLTATGAVVPTQISTAQSAYPNDSATITSSVAGNVLPATGTVIFRLYGPTAGATASANCLLHGNTVGSGGLLYTQTNNNVGGAHQVTTSTTNTSVSVNVSETYYWRVTYATGDTAHTGRQSDCVENTVLTFNNDSGPATARSAVSRRLRNSCTT